MSSKTLAFAVLAAISLLSRDGRAESGSIRRLPDTSSPAITSSRAGSDYLGGARVDTPVARRSDESGEDTASATPPERRTTPLSIPLVLDQITQDSLRLRASSQPIDLPWWDKQVHSPIRLATSNASIDVNQLLQLTMNHSTQLQVFSEVPLIRETAITEADAAFDWNAFVDGLWDDTSDPVGNTLTVGGTGNRYNDHTASTTAGIRRRTTTGANVEIAQRLGHQSNNSTFFIPNDQATTRLTLNFTQPLLRGRGKVYNTSLTVLAQIDTAVAADEFERQLESHLLEVSRSYWALYLERGVLAQQVRLYARSKEIVDQLESRRHIDAPRTQLSSAQAALAERRSDLIRAQAAVKNAETRMRGLVNAPDLGDPEIVEIIPLDRPSLEYIPFGLQEAMEIAVQHRSEVLQALKQIRAGGVRLNMAKHEMLPVLNAVTEFYVSGLRGASDLGQAWQDQFDTGSPSYSVGLQFEVPVQRRALAARMSRRRIELRQLESQYRNALQTVRNEIEIAVREVQTSYDEMHTKSQSMVAASLESETLQARWHELANVDSSGALVLEALLRAQERVAKTEAEFLTAQMTYNLALTNIKRAMGVLVESENGSILRSCECGVPSLQLDKRDSRPMFSELPVQSDGTSPQVAPTTGNPQ